MAAPNLVEAVQIPMSPETLSLLPKIHGTPDLWPKFLAKMELFDQSKRGLQLSQTALAFDAAITGQGVALVSRSLASSDIAADKLLEIGTLHTVEMRDFNLLTLRKSAPNAAIDTVVSWLTLRAKQVR